MNATPNNVTCPNCSAADYNVCICNIPRRNLALCNLCGINPVNPSTFLVCAAGRHCALCGGEHVTACCPQGCDHPNHYLSSDSLKKCRRARTKVDFFCNRFTWTLSAEQLSSNSYTVLNKLVTDAILSQLSLSDVLALVETCNPPRGLRPFVKKECKTAVKCAFALEDGCQTCKANGAAEKVWKSHATSDCLNAPASAASASAPAASAAPSAASAAPAPFTVKTVKGDPRNIYANKQVKRSSAEVLNDEFVGDHGHPLAFRVVEHVLGVIMIAQYIWTTCKKVIGLGVAANHGRPCGGLGVGMMTGTRPVTHVAEKAQEEHVTSNWILSMFGIDAATQQRVYNILQGSWGLDDLDQNSTDTQTVQGVDYTQATPEDYYQAWYIPETQNVSAIQGSGSNIQTVPGSEFPVKMVFGAGPCTSKGRAATGSMSRTYNQAAATDYSIFMKSQRQAIASTLDAMIEAGVEIAMVPLLSCGIYARGVKGVPSEKIYFNFLMIVDDVLKERVGPNGEMRAQYFDDVVVPEFPGFANRIGLQTQSSASAAPVAAAPVAAVPVAVAPVDNETRLFLFRKRLFFKLRDNQKSSDNVQYLDRQMKKAILEGKTGLALISVLDRVRGLGDFIRDECRTAIKFADAGSDGCSKCRARGQADTVYRSHLDSECTA